MSEIKHFIYIERIDKIDRSLPDIEQKVRSFSKISSLIPGYIAWSLCAIPCLTLAIFLPTFMGEEGKKFPLWILDFTSKVNRMLWYYIFYYPAKLIGSLMV
jgi:hypothetical protein